MKFSYAYVTNEETRAIKDRLVRQHAKAFLTWRLGHPVRRTWSLARALRIWWLYHGPVAFTSTEDRRLYKEEVRQLIMTLYHDSAT